MRRHVDDLSDRFYSSGNAPADRSSSMRQIFPEAQFFQCTDVKVGGVSMEIATAKPGDVCIFQSGVHDPVEFSALGLARGVAAILTDQLLPCPLPQVIVADVERASCELFNRQLGDPSKKVLTIGVVGNAGKTTTSLLIAGVLRNLGIRTAYETDLGSCDGIVQTVDESERACGAAMIQRIHDAAQADCGAIVIDLSRSVMASHVGVEFDVLVVTGTSTDSPSTSRPTYGFGPDPLEIALEHLVSDAVVFVPADHPKLVRRVDDTGHRRLTYGMRREADISAKVFDHQPGEMTLLVDAGDETAAMETFQCGEAMAMNQLAAIGVAMLMEKSLPEAIEIVSRLPSVPGRMQRMTGFDTAAVVLDAGGNSSRLGTTLRTLRQQRAGGKLWCIMTLDSPISAVDDEMAICGRLIEKHADKVILTSTKDCKPTFLQAAHSLLDGFRAVTIARLVADSDAAIHWAIKHASPSDTIVIIGGTEAQTAHDSRTRIQQLERMIESGRQESTTKRSSGPATIKMFS